MTMRFRFMRSGDVRSPLHRELFTVNKLCIRIFLSKTMRFRDIQKDIIMRTV